MYSLLLTCFLGVATPIDTPASNSVSIEQDNSNNSGQSEESANDKVNDSEGNSTDDDSAESNIDSSTSESEDEVQESLPDNESDSVKETETIPETESVSEPETDLISGSDSELEINIIETETETEYEEGGIVNYESYAVDGQDNNISQEFMDSMVNGMDSVKKRLNLLCVLLLFVLLLQAVSIGSSMASSIVKWFLR